MSSNTRKMTLSALFAALCVISLFVASVWPTGRFALVAFASLFVASAVIEGGISSGISVFVVSSIIGMLILPNRAAPLFFIMFFGYYPVAKSLIEHIKGILLQWAFKLALFNASMFASWFLLRELLVSFISDNLNIFRDSGYDYSRFLLPLMFIANVVFIIFDFGFTKLIWLYINRISKFMRKDNIS